MRAHLTFANVMSVIALFVALGGVGYAAATLPKNSVGTAQIKKDAVTGAKVKNSSLTGTDIKNKSLTAADFDGSIQGQQGPQGVRGPTGPQGEPGPPGQLPADSLVVVNAAKALSTSSAQTISGSQGEPPGFGADLPLSGASWTQRATETNEVAGGVVDVTWPDNCWNGGDFSGVYIEALVDGKIVASTGAETSEHPGETRTLDFYPGIALFEPGQDTPRTLTVKVHDACDTGQHFAVGGLRLTVRGTR